MGVIDDIREQLPRAVRMGMCLRVEARDFEFSDAEIEELRDLDKGVIEGLSEAETSDLITYICHLNGSYSRVMFGTDPRQMWEQTCAWELASVKNNLMTGYAAFSGDPSLTTRLVRVLESFRLYVEKHHPGLTLPVFSQEGPFERKPVYLLNGGIQAP